jgi:hypothetical protein
MNNRAPWHAGRAHRLGSCHGSARSEHHLRLESMAELSLTQTSEQSPKIFVDTAGFPLPVYLDVNPEIPARPRLIRLLRVRAIMLCMYSID